MPHVNTYTLHIQEGDDDPQQKMFLLGVPWGPVEPDADAVDVALKLDGGTWRDMGSPIELVVQVTPRTEGQDNGAH